MDTFVHYLCQEIQLIASSIETKPAIDTIFLGGGTPSLLSPDQLERIFKVIEQNFNLLSCREITLEANPGTVDREKLRFFHSLGIDRISFGVQSFVDSELQFLGRIHDARTAIESIQLAFNSGFKRINLDLITAFQGQTLETMEHNLQQAVELPVDHISVYTLILEKHTPFYKKYQNGEIKLIRDDEERAFYEKTMKFLKGHGFIHYEVSNFYQQGSQPCIHNMNYWSGKPYLGLGPSAHSYIPSFRWGNVRSLKKYISRIQEGTLPLAFVEKLTPDAQKMEYLYLRLRLREGFSLQEYQQHFHEDFTEIYSETIQTLCQKGLAVLESDRFYLTDEGILLADEIVLQF